MNKMTPSFDNKDCISCSMCVQACPVSALELSRRGKTKKYRNLFPELVDSEKCIGCKQCQVVCPMDCVVFSE